MTRKELMDIICPINVGLDASMIYRKLHL